MKTLLNDLLSNIRNTNFDLLEAKVFWEEQKKKYQHQGDEENANFVWAILAIITIHHDYRSAHEKLQNAEYYEAWCEAEKVELTGQMTAAIKRCPKPVIAMVNGAAAGAGAGVAFACDFRILADNAKLILAFINLGLTGDSCSMYYLSRMIGTAKTMELMMLGKPVEADKALELGLAYKVAPADELAEVTYKFAKRLANGPTTAYGMQKAQINKFFFADLDEFLVDEGANMFNASKTSDFSEAVNAFLEKRKPTFTGK